MRLSEALTILHEPINIGAPDLRLFLACGFTPLHLRTFIAARLRLTLPQQRVEVQTGVYGDLLGNLERLRLSTADCGAIVLEWSDLDLRLGLRSLGGWLQTDTADVIEGAILRIAAIEQAIDRVPSHLALTVSLPTLPVLPLDPTVSAWKAGPLTLRLQESLSKFALRVGGKKSVTFVNPDWIDQLSPMSDRLDVKSDLLDGFPYTLKHASIVAGILADLIQTPVPKKGLITDLDNTLWKGLLGELGPQRISWDLDRKSHMHGVYQALLRSLAQSGILIAIASKNTPALVAEAFQRKDIILREEDVFPCEVHWGHKSESVKRILEIWNIGADSVVFVDDSLSELAEVKAVHPAIECLQFPSEPQGIYDLGVRLRNLFSKPVVTEEDRLRLTSIRNNPQKRTDLSLKAADAFLEQAESVITFNIGRDFENPRILELINKTNQFNLNGTRHTETSLRRILGAPSAFVLKVNYKDKFGPLGQISMLLGCPQGPILQVYTWVMSCRAFSRRIEHAALQHLFRAFQVETLEFDFMPTDRNTPLVEFFTALLGRVPEARFRLSRDQFDRACPRLSHRVED